jgi:DUF1365 family protein
VKIDVRREQERRLATELQLSRRALDAAAMTSLMMSYPFMAWRVSAAIYWQALRLRSKGAAFHAHPRRRDSSGRGSR